MFEEPILCASIGWRCLCRMVTQIRQVGVGGTRWSSGRHGLSYFNLEYLSHLILILIPLLRGFYFSEDMLSNVHTEDVYYRRTKPGGWWWTVKWPAVFGPIMISIGHLTHGFWILVKPAIRQLLSSPLSPLHKNVGRLISKYVDHKKSNVFFMLPCW